MSFWKGFGWAVLNGAAVAGAGYAASYGIQKGREALEAKTAAKNQPKQDGK